MNLNGGLTISGTGRLNLEATSSTSGASTVNVGGDFTSTGTSTVVDWGTGTVTNNVINVTGNFTKSGTGTFTSASTSAATGFVFNKTGTQTFSYSGTNSDYTRYTVNSTSTLQMLTGLTISSLASPSSSLTINGTLDASTFTIAGGATNGAFTLASGATLKSANTNGVVSATSGSISNTFATATFNAAANYEFNGSAAQTTNFPSTVSIVNNLTINNSAANVKIEKSITVNGNVIMSSGNLDLNGSFNITLGSTSSLNSETSAKAIINSGSPSAGNGWIGTSRTVNAPSALNVANLGMTLTTASSMGTTFIKRFPKAISSVGTGNSISRHYSIAPTTQGTSATVVLSYFDTELNSNSETDPPMVEYNSTTEGSGYGLIGSTAADATANTVTFTPTTISTTATYWTLASSGFYYTTQAG
ncbi:MAG TPA: hypothetical protein VKH37_03420, partial [Ferruginibacter sp.]|nr:hypothetical protein [Ferruginibacter sp.]